MTDKANTQMETKERLGKIGPRPYWVFRLSILIRAVHQVGAAVFLTSYLLGEIPAVPMPYISLVMLSGVVLLFTEWLRHRQIYREISGLSTAIKLLLIGLAFHGFLPETPLVLAGFLLASISSHAPKQYRHRLLF
ncbi:MAG: hypothetical protein QNJ17_01830 [Desulfocapsaceae bacterium]|nr:hypothetical protein [Desulfocapsaceae bacterium]